MTRWCADAESLSVKRIRYGAANDVESHPSQKRRRMGHPRCGESKNKRERVGHPPLYYNVVVLRKFFSRPVYLIGALLLLIGGGYALRHTPVLLHVFAETDCACGDLHGEVTGLIIRNPFRDHAPEQSAARFLEELRNGRCNESAPECEYDLDHRVSDWKLAYRRDRGPCPALLQAHEIWSGCN